MEFTLNADLKNVEVLKITPNGRLSVMGREVELSALEAAAVAALCQRMNPCQPKLNIARELIMGKVAVAGPQPGPMGWISH